MEDITLLDYKDETINANRYIIAFIFAVIIAFVVYYIITYTSPPSLDKGQVINWVVTGDSNLSSVARSDKTAYFSYNGFDYIKSEGDRLFLAEGVAYGKAYDNENPFWVAGGVPLSYLSPGICSTSIVNTYNGYDWINNENPLVAAPGIDYGLSGDNQSLWLATGGSKDISKSNIIFSKNGLEWEHSIGVCFNVEGRAIAYGKTIDDKHMYVAGGEDSRGGNYNILYSYEGMCWQVSQGVSFTSATYSACKSIAYGVSSDKTTKIWVAAGSSDDITNILYSLDGVSWKFTTGTSFADGQGYGVAFGLTIDGKPLWTATGFNDPTLAYSYNGHHWNKGDGLSFLQGESVAFGKTVNDDPMWVAVGNDKNGENDEIVYSYNGTSWISTNDPVFGASIGRGVASNVLKHSIQPFNFS